MSDKNNCFKEAVCIEAQRIFDSCSDRDGIFDLPVKLTCGSITDDLTSVKVKCAEVEVSCISVDSVMFKAGYYAVDITYNFTITAEAFANCGCKVSAPQKLCGNATWNKRVILCGGEGNAKVYDSEQKLPDGCDTKCDFCCCGTLIMPKATVRVIDPVALEAKFMCLPKQHHGCHPDCIPCCAPVCMPCADEAAENVKPPCPHPGPIFEKTLVVSLGLFSVVQLSRPVSLIVPAYDYCVPQKECINANNASETANDIFDRLDFPTEQFFPQYSCDQNCPPTEFFSE